MTISFLPLQRLHCLFPFPGHTAPDRSSGTMLNRSDASRHPYTVTDLKDDLFHVLLSNMTFSVAVVYSCPLPNSGKFLLFPAS